jgi:hypothetical protein
MAYIGNSPVQDETVTSAQIVDGAIVDADVNSSAAIAFSKMANLTASRLLVSDGSGDVSVSNVTSAEALLLDGGTSATSTTLAAADRLIVNDNGTIVQVALSDFETFIEGAIDTLSSAMTFSSTVTVGSDGSGQDVIFYSGTSGDNLTWDSSEECLTITGTDGAQALKVADGDLVVVDKLYIYDNDGGEYISGDGTTLTITAGGASSVKLDANSRVSLSNNDSGTSNTILGKSAGASLDAGSNYNVFIGENVSDAAMNDAVENTAVGYSALSSLTSGDENTMIGRLAGRDIGSGSGNVMIGSASGYQAEEDVAQCVIIGRGAFNGVATDAANGTVAIGYGAGAALTSGQANVAIGYQALDACTTGDANTAVGHTTFTNVQVADDGFNTGIGYAVGVELTSGVANTYLGANAGYYNETGSNNTYIGKSAGAGANNNNNSNNTGVGKDALKSITDGTGNVAVGLNAGDDITEGIDNTAVGLSALHSLTTGTGNIGIGASANQGVTTTTSNVAVGNSSGGDTNVSGSYNTCMGQAAGYDLESGANNLLLGYQAGRSSSPSGEVDSESNVVVLGNNSISALYCADDSISTSDGRDKADIENSTIGLDFVNQMRPVTYRWDRRSWYVEENFDDMGVDQITKEDIASAVSDGSKKKDKINLGFIAQEIQSLEREIGYSGVKEDGTADRDTELVVDTTADGSFLGIKYPRLIPILVNAVQELSQQVEDLKKKVG